MYLSNSIICLCHKNPQLDSVVGQIREVGGPEVCVNCRSLKGRWKTLLKSIVTTRL